MKRTLEPQDQISRYRVVGALGAGGMGEVYAAKDETLDRLVALKVLPPRLVRNEERVRRFIVEAKSASSLNHPNIVTIYEIGQDRVRAAGAGADPEPQSDPVHFISMELVTGETLSQKIHEEGTDLRTLLGWLAQAADGIAKAHAAGIVHRDLKPGNIMISKDGFAKVLDFGLAKLTERQSVVAQDVTNVPTEMPATGEGLILGTTGYMSPEQVQGKPVDPRSDVFSLGCVLYEAATRKRPFAADSDVEIMHRILRDRPTPVEEVNPQVPAEVRRIIRRCLAKNADQRFQSMKDLALELHEAYDEYESLPVSGSSASSMSSTGVAALPRRRRGLVAGVIVAAVVVIAAIVGGYALLAKRSQESDAGSAAVPEMKMNVLMSRDDLDEFVISGDGRYLAYVSAAEGKTSLYVRQIRTGSDVQVLPAQSIPIRGLSFSPDGDYVDYINRDPQLPNYQALFQVPSLGGAPRKVFFDVDSAAGFSPDGTRVCFRRGRPDVNSDTLVVGELATGKDRELARIKDPETTVSAPVWSPDGKRVAVAVQTSAGGFRSRLAVFDAGSGRREDVGSQPFTFADSVAWLPGGNALVTAAVIGASPTSQIFRVTYPGGQTRRLTNDLNGYRGISLAAAGQSIAAMRRTDVSNVWVSPADGARESRPLTTATGPSGSAGEPVPLADGGVVFTMLEGDKGTLWRATLDGSEKTRIAAQSAFEFGIHQAERAGILFSGVSGEDLVTHVWRVDPDGGGLRQLTDGKGELLQDVSADGSTMLFSKAEDRSTVWALDLSGAGEPKQRITNSTGDQPTFSPDGKLIRYSEFATENGRVRGRAVVIPAAGGDPVARFILPPGSAQNDWSADSKSISYIDENQGWNVMAQPLSGGGPFPLTHFTEGVTTLFAWAPDGSRLAAVRRIGNKIGLWSVTPGKGEPKLLSEFRSGTITEVRFSRDSKNVTFAYGTTSKDVVLISGFR